MKKIIFFAAAALTFAACGASTTEVKNTKTAKNTATVKNSANTAANSEPPKDAVFTAGKDPREDIISAAQKLQKLEFWSARITSETTPAANAEMEYTAPNRYHIKKTDGEIIVIGTDSYALEDGKWTKLPDDIGAEISSQTKSGLAEGIKSLQDVKIVGKEKLNGKDATVYSHRIGEVTTKIWIANDTGLQLKNEVEAMIDGEFEKQTTVYDYAKKVKIEAPKVD